jgi:glycosyltransferase involved in cell wall biosynthesis
MDDEKNRAAKIFFFGAGKLGTYWIRQLKTLGMEPEGVFDNDESLWGSLCDGIPVCDPAKIEDYSMEYVFITCRKEKEISSQLSELGLAGEKIVAGSHNVWNHLCYLSAKNHAFADSMIEAHGKNREQKIFFDLYNGMVLGGVESWSYALAKELKKQGHQGMYLTTDAAGPVVADGTYPAFMFRYRGIESEKEKIEVCIKKIVENRPCTIICNFPQHIFCAACIAKQMYPDQVRIIAVQHNDEPPYYDGYSLWQKEIDKCMVISSRIREKLLLFGMEANKVECLEWKVLCRERIERIWRKQGGCLQIGYAGRITVLQKRLDLLFKLSERLREKAVHFQINIAGAGDYSEVLQKRIKEENFGDCMSFVGYLERRNIPDFWRKQDIMVSCSEWEGHSISQSEAMAEGVVPVITDVSGARDDVEDGYNGFIVNVGDIEAMAEKICYLYQNLDELERMGKHAHVTIYNRQKNMDQGLFWERLIKRVWQ